MFADIGIYLSPFNDCMLFRHTNVAHFSYSPPPHPLHGWMHSYIVYTVSLLKSQETILPCVNEFLRDCIAGNIIIGL